MKNKMKYVSGIFALNMECELETDGHYKSVAWEKMALLESRESILGDYGIEGKKEIPGHAEKFHVANHIRAILDMLVMEQYDLAQGMKNDFIGNDEYTGEIFAQVKKLVRLPNWPQISWVMEWEYKLEWLRFSKENGLPPSDAPPRYKTRGTKIDTGKARNMDERCNLTLLNYAHYKTIQDLYELAFICNEHWDSLSSRTILCVTELLSHGAFEDFYYFMETQYDPSIDRNTFFQHYLGMYRKLGLPVP